MAVKGKKVLALWMALCMLLVMIPVTASAAEGAETSVTEVSTQEGLVQALNDSTVSSILLTDDIVLKFEDGKAWTPVTVEQGRTLEIDGDGHTISGLTIREYILESSGSGEAGDGSSCDYYAGFIGNNKGDLTIRRLNFSGADVDMKPLSGKSTGSSILAVVCGNNTGTLAYEDVNVADSTVKGYTKVGILHGFTQAGSFSATHCAVTGSKVVLEADGSDPDAALSGIILGYDPHGEAVIDGIKLDHNTCEIADSVKWADYERKTSKGTTTAVKGDAVWGLTSQTYCVGSQGATPVLFPIKRADGYAYRSFEQAGLQVGSTITLTENVSCTSTWLVGAGEDLTLDLNGNTLQVCEEDGVIGLVSGGKLTVRDSAGDSGRLEIASRWGIEVHGNAEYTDGSKPQQKNAVLSTLTMENGMITAGTNTATVKLFGNGATLVMNGGTISNTFKNGSTDGNFAVAGNGTRNSQTGIDYGGACIQMSGGELVSEQDCALYLPGYHDTVISGGTVKGWAGIEMDSGNLQVTGGKVESTYRGDGTRKYKKEGDGNYNFGTALAIVSKGSQAATGYFGRMKIDISGGSFVSPTYYAVDEYNLAHVQNSQNPSNTYVESFSITGGAFSGEKGALLLDNHTKIVSGGYFTDNPNPNYLADGKYAVASDLAGYLYMIGEAPDVSADVAITTGTPAVELDSDLDGLAEEVKEKIQESAETVDSPSLPALAGTEAQKLNETTVEQGASALQGVLGQEPANVTLVVRPYFAVVPTAYSTESGSPQFKLEIQPKCEIIATTLTSGEVASDPGKIVTTEGSGQNAVVLEDKNIETTAPVQVTVTLPEALLTGFSGDYSTLFVRHDAKNGVYYYSPTVNPTTREASFLNPHGFSEFTFQADTRKGSVVYTFADESTETMVYTPAEIASSLPVDSKAGASFLGWKITVDGAELEKTYTAMSEELLDAINGKTADAEPVFRANSGGGEEPEAWVNPFTDVKEKDWFYDAVKYVSEKGLFLGTGDTAFSPAKNMERGMLVTVLYRLEGEPKAERSSFTDVSADAYYTAAVDWAASHDIVTGYGGNKFGPKDSVTREQLACVLYRYAAYKGWNVTGSASLEKFSDGAKASGWAETALAWAVDAGILQGYGDGRLNPRGYATRAEVAKMLTQFCTVYLEK